MFGRAAWGHLRLATEWSDETQIPKETVFAILDNEIDLFCLLLSLMGISLAILLYIATTISITPPPSQNVDS